MIRLAAVADLHFRSRDKGKFRERFAPVKDEADLLVLPGDLTDYGTVKEMNGLISDLATVGVPVIAVLGNHDFNSRQETTLIELLRDNGIAALDGNAVHFTIRGARVGFAGCKGFGGGFGAYALPSFGEKAAALWVEQAQTEQAKIENGLAELAEAQPACDLCVVVLHYAPVRDTLVGEPLELYPFLGSSRLLEPIEQHSVDLVLHGHAHHGSPRGISPGGIPVYNVAAPLINKPYALFELGGESKPD